MPPEDESNEVMTIPQLMEDICTGIASGHHRLIHESATDLGALVTKSAEVEVDFELSYQKTSDNIGARVGVTTNYWPEVSLAKENEEITRKSRARIKLQVVHVAAETPLSVPAGNQSGGNSGTAGTGTGSSGGWIRPERDRWRKDPEIESKISGLFGTLYQSDSFAEMRRAAEDAIAHLNPEGDPELDPRARGEMEYDRAAFEAIKIMADHKRGTMQSLKSDLQIALCIAAPTGKVYEDNEALAVVKTAKTSLEKMKKENSVAAKQEIAKMACSSAAKIAENKSSLLSVALGLSVERTFDRMSKAATLAQAHSVEETVQGLLDTPSVSIISGGLY